MTNSNSKNNAWGADTTIDEVLSGVDLSGKRVVVTGASGGLGLETARALASAGASVVLAARDQLKLQSACDQIRQDLADADLSLLVLDLASLAKIRSAAADCLERFEQIDVLINNAGVMFCPLMRTEDDFEMQFGVCHLGHFLFTGLVMPALLRAEGARIVNLTSGGHTLGDVDFDDPNYHSRPYDKWQSYGQAKSANVLFSVGLSKRLAQFGITANAVHPGMIMETDLGRHLKPEDYEYLMALGNPEDFAVKSLQAGAATTVWAATAPELRGKGGLYLEDCHIAEANDEEGTAGGFRRRVVDPVRAERLWALSEALVGQQFEW